MHGHDPSLGLRPMSAGGEPVTSGRSPRSGREWTLPAAPALMVLLALKYVFCWALLRRRSGAWMALLLWESTALLAALARPGLPVLQRLLEIGVAGTCLVLLGAAAATFPAPKLPPR